ncbi:MAG: hypothetical protein RR454_01035 [Clostridia bacterium]
MKNFNISLNIDIEIIIRDNTIIADSPIGALASMLNSVLKASKSAFNFANGTYKITLAIDVKIDLVDFTKSNFKIEIILNDKDLGGNATVDNFIIAAIYYFGDENLAYLDLSNLGLMKVKLMGLDIRGLIENKLIGAIASKFSGKTSSSSVVKLYDENKELATSNELVTNNAIATAAAGAPAPAPVTMLPCGCKNQECIDHKTCIKQCTPIYNNNKEIIGFNCPDGTINTDAKSIKAGKCVRETCPQNKRHLTADDLYCGNTAGSCMHRDLISKGDSSLKIIFARGSSEKKMNINIEINNAFLHQVLGLAGVPALMAKAGLDIKIPDFNSKKAITISLSTNLETRGSSVSALEKIKLNLNLSRPSDTVVKNELELSLSNLKISNSSTYTVTMPDTNARKSFSGLSLGALNGVINGGKFDMASLGSIVDNVIDSLAGWDNSSSGKPTGSILDIRIASNAKYRTHGGGMSTKLRGINLKIGKQDNQGGNAKYNGRLYANIADDTDNLDVTVWIDFPNLRIDLASAFGLAPIANPIIQRIDIKPFGTATSLGALISGALGGGGGNIGGDAPDAPVQNPGDNTNAGGAATKAGIDKFISGIVLDVANQVNSTDTTITAVLNPVGINELIQKINNLMKGLVKNGDGTPKYGATEPNTSIPRVILEMLHGLLAGMKVPVGLLSAFNAGIVDIAAALFPIPTVGVGDTVEAVIHLDANNMINGHRSALYLITLSIANSAGEKYDITINANGIRMLPVESANPVFGEGQLVKRNITDPYNLDQNANGTKDYLENLPTRANVSYYFDGGTEVVAKNGVVNMNWGDLGQLIDPTRPSSYKGDTSNKINIEGYILNQRYNNSQLVAELLPQNVRKAKMMSGKMLDGTSVVVPNVICDGLTYPMVIDPYNLPKLSSTVTINMVNSVNENSLGNGADVGTMTFTNCKWDYSEITKDFFGQEGAAIYLTYGNGVCKDVKLRIPVSVKAKSLLGLSFYKDTDEVKVTENGVEKVKKVFEDGYYNYDIVGCPLTFDPYNFKGLPTKVLAKYEGSFAPIEVEAKWILTDKQNNKINIAPDYRGASYRIDAYIGNAQVGYQLLEGILIKFMPKQIEQIVFTETNLAKMVFDPYDDTRKATDVNNYPAKAKVLFTDGTYFKEKVNGEDNYFMSLSWNFNKVKVSYLGGVTYATVRIGDTGANFQTFDVPITLKNRQVNLNTLGLLQMPADYDILSNLQITPTNKAYYKQTTTTVTYNDKTVGTHIIDWDTSAVKVDYKGGIYYAKAKIGNAYGGVQVIEVPVKILSREVVNVKWDKASNTVNTIDYPISINPYSDVIDQNTLPKTVDLIFTDGTEYKNYKLISTNWNTSTLKVSYTGDASSIRITLTIGGIQYVDVPVNVQRKIIKDIKVEQYTFDVFDATRKPTDTDIYAKEAWAEFEDGSFMKFGGTGVGSNGTITWDLSNLANASYNGSTIYAVARVGNLAGGFQNVNIPVFFVDRTISDLKVNFEGTEVKLQKNVVAEYVINDIFSSFDPRGMLNYAKTAIASFKDNSTAKVKVEWNILDAVNNFNGYKSGVYKVYASVGNNSIGYQNFEMNIVVKDRTIVENKKLKENIVLSYDKLTVNPYVGLKLPTTMNVSFIENGVVGLSKLFYVEWFGEDKLNLAPEAFDEVQYIYARVGNVKVGYQDIPVRVNVENKQITYVSNINSNQNLLDGNYTINAYDKSMLLDSTMRIGFADNTFVNAKVTYNMFNFSIPYAGIDGAHNYVVLRYGTNELAQEVKINITVKPMIIDKMYSDFMCTKELFKETGFVIFYDPYEYNLLPKSIYVKFKDGTTKLVDVKWTKVNANSMRVSLISALTNECQVKDYNYQELAMDTAKIAENIVIDPYNYSLPDFVEIDFNGYKKAMRVNWAKLGLQFKYDGTVVGGEAKKTGKQTYTVQLPFGNDEQGYAETVEATLYVKNLTITQILSDLTIIEVDPYEISNTLSSLLVVFAEPNADGNGFMTGYVDANIDYTSIVNAYKGGEQQVTLLLGNAVGQVQTTFTVNVKFKNRTIKADVADLTLTINPYKTLEQNITDNFGADALEKLPVTFTDGTKGSLSVYWNYADIFYDYNGFAPTTAQVLVGNKLGGYQYQTINVVCNAKKITSVALEKDLVIEPYASNILPKYVIATFTNADGTTYTEKVDITEWLWKSKKNTINMTYKGSVNNFVEIAITTNKLTQNFMIPFTVARRVIVEFKLNNIIKTINPYIALNAQTDNIPSTISVRYENETKFNTVNLKIKTDIINWIGGKGFVAVCAGSDFAGWQETTMEVNVAQKYVTEVVSDGVVIVAGKLVNKVNNVVTPFNPYEAIKYPTSLTVKFADGTQMALTARNWQIKDINGLVVKNLFEGSENCYLQCEVGNEFGGWQQISANQIKLDIQKYVVTNAGTAQTITINPYGLGLDKQVVVVNINGVEHNFTIGDKLTHKLPFELRGECNINFNGGVYNMLAVIGNEIAGTQLIPLTVVVNRQIISSVNTEIKINPLNNIAESIPKTVNVTLANGNKIDVAVVGSDYSNLKLVYVNNRYELTGNMRLVLGVENAGTQGFYVTPTLAQGEFGIAQVWLQVSSSEGNKYVSNTVELGVGEFFALNNTIKVRTVDNRTIENVKVKWNYSTVDFSKIGTYAMTANLNGQNIVSKIIITPDRHVAGDNLFKAVGAEKAGSIREINLRQGTAVLAEDRAQIYKNTITQYITTNEGLVEKTFNIAWTQFANTKMNGVSNAVALVKSEALSESIIVKANVYSRYLADIAKDGSSYPINKVIINGTEIVIGANGTHTQTEVEVKKGAAIVCSVQATEKSGSKVTFAVALSGAEVVENVGTTPVSFTIQNFKGQDLTFSIIIKVIL